MAFLSLISFVAAMIAFGNTPALAITTGCAQSPSAPAPLPSSVTAQAWLVADLDNGTVLATCNPHERHAPASTIKLLTALTVVPDINAQDMITITSEDLNFEPGSSAVGLVRDGHYTIETLLLGLLLVSGNDAANTLARIANTHGVPGTIAQMNAVAHHLGARDTTAVNPHGLDEPAQLTSAYDLAVIMRAALTHNALRRYLATPFAVVPAQGPGYPEYQIQNDNRLLANYPGALGGKTGYTDLARHTFVGAAERDGRRLVVTLMRGEHTPVSLWQQGAALLDWGFGVPANASAVDNLGTDAAKHADKVAAIKNHPSTPNDTHQRSSFWLMAGIALLMVIGGLAGYRYRDRAKSRGWTSETPTTSWGAAARTRAPVR